MKILRFLLTAICFLMSSQTLFAWNNGDEFTVNGFTYHIIDVEQATVALYSTTKTGEVTIPATVFDGKDQTFTVVSVGASQVKYKPWTGVTSVSLPNTIKSIGEYAFKGSFIKTLNLPASLEEISIYFNYQSPSTLESFTVDSSNPYYEAVNGILYTKGKKALVVYPKGNKAHQGGTFSIPNGVTEIAPNAFVFAKFTTLSIPASVSMIGLGGSWTIMSGAPNTPVAYGVLFGSLVQNITVNSSNNAFKSNDGVLLTKDGKKLVLYPPKKTTGVATIPNGVKEILPFAMTRGSFTSLNLNQVEILYVRSIFQCNSMTTISVPATFKTYEPDAVCYCTSFSSFTVSSSNSNYKALDGVLFSADGKVLVAYPMAKTGDTFPIPNTTTEIAYRAFQHSAITSINIPKNVTLISTEAFKDSKSLSTVTFESNSSLKAIGQSAFRLCPIVNITLPASLDTLGVTSFSQCTSLKTVTIESGSQLKVICPEAFEGCADLESFTFANTSVLDSIGYRAFADTKLAAFTIPSTVKTIGESAFNGCRQLAKVTFPADNVSVLYTIGAGAFANSAFTLTRIPSSVKTIGREAFWNVKTAETINLSANIESISTEAFKGCYSLTALDVDKKNPNFSSIDGFLLSRDKKTLMICPPGKAQNSSYVLLPPSLTRIGDYAFYENSKLKSVVIPAKVTSLGKRAFGLCTALNRLVMLCDNPISGDSIAQKLNESTFDDGLTTPTDRRANITLSVRKDKLYDYFGDEYYLNFKSFTPSFDYAGGEYMELDTKKHMFVAPKNNDNTFVIPTSWGATNPDRVVAIADYAFENASSGIKEVVGPLYLEYIGAKAFMTNPAANSSSIENVFLLNGDYQGNKFTNSTYATTRFELDETGHDYSEFAPTTKVFLKKNVFHSTAFLFSSKRYLLDVKTSLGETVRTATPQMFDYRIPFQVNSTYSTFCREFPTDFSEFNFSSRKPDLLNVIAFTAGRYLKKQRLNGEQVNVIQMTSINEGKDGDGVVIPANTGVVIKTTDGKTPEDYFYQIYEDPTFETYFNEYDEATVVRGIVKRSQTVQPTEGNLVNFILSGDRVHRMTVAREIPVHRSYLQVLRGDLQDGAATIMKFFEGDDEELLSTGLETFEQAVGNDVIYDLQGLPVRQPRKGVYIKNGKKIVVK